MSSLDPRLLAIWAKTNREGNQAHEIHPLICHMIDVGVVARALWREVLTPTLKERIANGLGLDLIAAEAWVAYLAALHDLGKASSAFQAKYPPSKEPLAAAGLHVTHPELDEGHGIVSTLALRTLLNERHNVPMPRAMAVATAVGGHHGIFPESARLQNAQRNSGVEGKAWNAARQSLAGTIEALFDVPEQGPTSAGHPTCMVLAGLISVADWIGSDSSFFTFADTTMLASDNGLRSYMTQAEASASNALTKLGWRDWTAPVEEQPFDMLFGFEPRPVQRNVAELPGLMDGPGIVIIELPMGEGKTEAALYLADRWAQQTGQRGLYVAMPTMATSNGMFGRLLSYLDSRFPAGRVNVQLIHSHAAISPELEALNQTDNSLPVQPDDIAGIDGLRDTPAEIVIADWFSRRKRGLLAPYGVGTVDQALLAALQVPHVFVRTFGLAGKTIIFDEVHAYDTYMSTLFERLIEWLGALGSSVVVLTATLPLERHDALLMKYASGAGITLSGSIPPTEYPRLSWVSQTGADAQPVPIDSLSDLSKRRLRIEWADTRIPATDGAPFPLAERLHDALRDGGCAAVICNTVGRAQAMYRALASSFKDEIDLLHARFPFEERDQREKQALVRFSKPGGTVATEDGTLDVERPPRRVLVATQIIEQSLDLDFDLIVTDLAPADLVIQRAGRLQRHERDRPAAFLDNPVLWVGLPEALDGTVPRFDSGSEAIYDDHILLRSWLALNDRSTIAFPTDIATIIEEVYDRTRDCPSDDPALRERWATTLEAQKDIEGKEQQEAHTKWILDPHAGQPLWRMTRDPTHEDTPEAHRQFQALTRLTLPTVSIVVLWDSGSGATYDAAGTQPANTTRPPSMEETKRLLRRSVSVSHRGVFGDLLNQAPPAAWQRSSLLRRHRLVILDANNRFETEKHVLELDPELGLLIKRKEDK